MPRVARRRTKPRAKSRPLWRKLLAPLTDNLWGRLAVAAGTLAALAYWQRAYVAQELYPMARDQVLRGGGVGIFPATLWTLLVLAMLRLRSRWVWRPWRWWLASALLITSVWAALGGIHGPGGVMAEATLGGAVGRALWGDTPLRGIPVVGGLTLLALTILWPWRVYRSAKAALRTSWTTSRASLRHISHRTSRGIQLLDLATWSAIATLLQLLQRKRRTGQPSSPTALSPMDTNEVKLPKHPPIAIPVGSVSEKGDASLPPQPQHGEELSLLTAERDGRQAGVSAATANAQGEKRAIYSGPGWKLPALSLLEKGQAAIVSKEETQQVAAKIQETFGHHGVQVTVDQIKPGPTVTLYGLTPGWIRRTREARKRDESGNLIRDARGKAVISRKEDVTRVRVDSIVAREKDLALALAAPSLRIQAPVPGESVVGIEVPNRDPVLVTLRGVMESPAFKSVTAKGGLPLALGQGPGGNPVATDLRQLPHLLVAGATGSGKSVCLNALLVSMVSQVSPERLRLLLIDPKRVELTPFNGLPHLVSPVVVDTERAVKALKAMLREMMRRYRRMEELGVRNIEGYHNHPQALEPMPYIGIAVDELADLMMAAPYDIEQTLCRLAQLGRATGIHLVVATQRPSVDVVTGLIKANFPSRISFAVVSHIDSRTILDSAGAERLLGKGDMLYLSGATPKPQRVQGAFVSDREIGRLMEFWRSQVGPPLPQFDLEPVPEESQGDAWEGGETRGGGQDDLMEKAMELASRYSHLSTSLLQRRLRIGYPRAARLMDQLEDTGVIGPSGEPGKPREVLLRADQRSQPLDDQST